MGTSLPIALDWSKDGRMSHSEWGSLMSESLPRCPVGSWQLPSPRPGGQAGQGTGGQAQPTGGGTAGSIQCPTAGQPGTQKWSSPIPAVGATEAPQEAALNWTRRLLEN